MRIAVLADIHGNMPALLAVVRELERLDPAPDHVVVNGDLINGTPLSPSVIDYVRAQDWIVIRGNHEFYYLDYHSDRAPAAYKDSKRWGQLHWLIEQISPDQGAFLAVLPDERTFFLPHTEPIRIAHGVPGRNRVGFYPQQPADKIVADIGQIAENVLVTAHTHVQFDRYILSGSEGSVALDGIKLATEHFTADLVKQIVTTHQWWHLINPGSVGLPLNQNVNAQFALLDSTNRDEQPDGWKVTHCQIPYDRRPILDAFHSSGMLREGGIMSRLFYWEICTAEPEIIRFYRWASANGYEPDADIEDTFRAYIEATGREQYVKKCDPCHQAT